MGPAEGSADLEEHGVTFQEATAVFADWYELPAHGEPREVIIGHSDRKTRHRGILHHAGIRECCSARLVRDNATQMIVERVRLLSRSELAAWG
jgi:uncharacterized DUF497 family protein